MEWSLRSRDTVSLEFSPVAAPVVDPRAFNHESKEAETIPCGNAHPSNDR
jgi:hypothetical protein